MLSVPPEIFDQWMRRARLSGNRMQWQQFTEFAEPTINTGNQWSLYSDVDDDLFAHVIRAVNDGSLKYSWPARFSEDMTSAEFKKRFGTGNAESNPDGTTADEPQNIPDR